MINLVKKLSLKTEISVLIVENLPKETYYITAIEMLAAFGQIDTIEKL